MRFFVFLRCLVKKGASGFKTQHFYLDSLTKHLAWNTFEPRQGDLWKDWNNTGVNLLLLYLWAAKAGSNGDVMVDLWSAKPAPRLKSVM